MVEFSIFRVSDDQQVFAGKARGKVPQVIDAEIEMALDLLVEDFKKKL